MRRAAALALFCVLVASCERCDSGLSKAEARKAVGSIAATATGRVAVKLSVESARASERGSGAWLIAAGRTEGDGWLRGVTLELGLSERKVGPTAVVLEGSRCSLRYMHEGVLSSADYQVAEATGEVREAAPRLVTHLTVLCQRRVDTTSSGRAHAAELPKEVRLEVQSSAEWR